MKCFPVGFEVFVSLEFYLNDLIALLGAWCMQYFLQLWHLDQDLASSFNSFHVFYCFSTFNLKLLC